MSKNNLILAGAFMLQVLVILGMRLGGQQSTKAAAVDLFVGFDADKVQKIEILGAPAEETGPKQNSVTIAKTGASWGIATADGFPADQEKVKDFLKKLGKLRSRNVVVRSAKYHEKLEVAEKKYQRKVTVTMDGKPTVFYVGSSPSFKNLHVRLDGADDVLMVNDITTGDFSDRAWGWVDRTYLKFEPSNVWGVNIANKSGTIALSKNAGDDSWVAEGVTEPLKKSVVDDLVRKASQLNLEEPVGKEAKAEYGLGEVTVSLTTGTSTSAGLPPPSLDTTTIHIGKKIEGENRYYVKASTNDYVVKVASWAIDPLVEKTKKDLVEAPAAEKK